MTEQLKEFTFLARTAPYGSDRSSLLLDIALASSVFEKRSNYVFMGDGIYQLLKGQNADLIQTKTFGKTLEALSLYGINDIYVHERSMKERCVSEEDLMLDPIVLNQEKLKFLIRNSRNLITL